MIGLAHYLRALGKQVRIVVSPALPAFLAFMDPAGWVEAFDPQGAHRDLAGWPGAWVLVDASEPRRLGPMLPLFLATPARKVCLDHHLKEAPEGFDEEFTDPSASASAELVYDLAARRMAPCPWPWPRRSTPGWWTTPAISGFPTPPPRCTGWPPN